MIPAKEGVMVLRITGLLLLVVTLAGAATVGTLNLQIKEYDVPTPKSRPHDPAVAPDGSLWYTGQGANKLGRLDPKTGEFKEYPLKIANSGAHGLVADKEGNIWFTAIAGGYVGKLDPKAGEIAEYRPSDGTRSTRTHRCSITMAFCGLPTKRLTISGGSIRKAGR